jgi:hypothetical protein
MIPSPVSALFPSRWEVPCVAVVAENHPLAGKVVISAEDLAGNRLIAFVNSFRLRRRINDVLSSPGVELSSVIDSNVTYVSLARAPMGLGVAIVESITFLGLPVKGAQVMPLSFPPPVLMGPRDGGRPVDPERTRLARPPEHFSTESQSLSRLDKALRQRAFPANPRSREMF